MATWLVRDDFDGAAGAVPEYRDAPISTGVGFSGLQSYGYGGDAPDNVDLLLNGSGGLTLDPETYANTMSLRTYAGGASSGPVTFTMKVKMRPAFVGYFPFGDDLTVYVDGVAVEMALWRFEFGAWSHRVNVGGEGWQPNVPTSAPMTGEDVTITISVFDGYMTVGDGSTVTNVPTGLPPYSGGAFQVSTTLGNRVLHVDYYQIEGGAEPGATSFFWTNFVQSFEVP